MIYLILFNDPDDETARVAVIRTGRQAALNALARVREVYEDPRARLVALEDGHDDGEAINHAWREMLRDQASDQTPVMSF